MNKYELLYIIDKDVTDENREASIKKINDKIADGNGVVISVDKWGTKKFTYPINFKNEGFYVLVTFEANAAILTEIESRMKVSDSFVRYMITSVIENKKTEAAKTAKKPERRERTDYRPRTPYVENSVADIVAAEVATEDVVAVEVVAVEVATEDVVEKVEKVEEVATAEVIDAIEEVVEVAVAEEIQA